MGRQITIARQIEGISEISVTSIYNADGTIQSLGQFDIYSQLYGYDGAGHPISVGNYGLNYAVDGAYNAAGQMTGLVLASSSGFTETTETRTFNNRLQIASIAATTPSATLLSLTYAYGPTAKNNGNISSITNNLNAARSQSFTYDNLNRLLSAQEGSIWGNSYVYDNWGNYYQANQVSGTGTGQSWQVTPTQSNGISRLTYDAAGNVTIDNLGNHLAYDAEGRISTAAGYTYVYDGDGNRVAKTGGANAKLYWRDVQGSTIMESDLSGNIVAWNISLNGQQIARRVPGPTNYFFLWDQVGMERVAVDSYGTLQDDIDWYPWGNASYVTKSTTGNPYARFGKEEDSETGQEDFGARHYSGSMGRFMTPDPVFASAARVMDPQQWNMYAYARNNPLSITDPTGLDFNLSCSGGNSLTCQNGVQGQTLLADGGGTRFEATDVDMNKQGDPSAGYSDQFGNNYTRSEQWRQLHR